MMTRLLTTTLLVLVGVGSTLPAQTRTIIRSSPERDDDRRATRSIISWLDADPDRPRLGLTAVWGTASDTLGILVDVVTSGGPAEKAGLRAGDRLIAINGVNLRLDSADAADAGMRGVAMRRLTRELGRQKVGDEVELRFARDGRTQTVRVATAAPEDVRPAITWASGMRRRADRASLGVVLGGATGPRDTSGIFVTRVASGGPAEKAGVQEGDRIASINGVDLRVPAEDTEDWAVASARVQRLNGELDKLTAGDKVELQVVRAGQRRTVSVTTGAARDLEPARGGMITIGDGSGFRGFEMTVPPAPPSPRSAPVPPTPPNPPDAPQVYFFDGDSEGPIRLRMSAPLRSELRGNLNLRTREALERALELSPRLRAPLRVEMDAPDREHEEREVIEDIGQARPSSPRRARAAVLGAVVI